MPEKSQQKNKSESKNGKDNGGLTKSQSIRGGNILKVKAKQATDDPIRDIRETDLLKRLKNRSLDE